LKELALLMERLRPEDSVVVALSGHGVQFAGDKYGYFCPLNANLGKKETLLPMEGDDGLLKLLDQGKAGRKLLIVNACRNKPASNANLAAERLQLRDDYNEEAPKGTIMLLACSKNQFSWFYDDKEKRTDRRNRSLFMYHLMEAWKGSYAAGKKVTVDHIVAEVSERVEGDANPDFGHNQIPIVKRKFEGRWDLAVVKVPLPKKEAAESKEATTAALAKQIDVDLGGSVKMTLMHIPPGKFWMGSPKEELERWDDEFRHEVEITKGFYMGKFDVTQEQYQAIMGENLSNSKGAKLPVEKVNWYDAKEFCRKLSAKEGKTFGLPSEAEWEYACRAGTTTPFHFGETISTDQANYEGEFVYGTGKKGVFRQKTTEVGRFPANAWGLHDMHGNVWQWCEDWYDKDFYRISPKQNPLNATEGKYRVQRGGSFMDFPQGCRSASRKNWGNVTPIGRSFDYGFRVVLRSS
jgi:formylglycine-generating enzyme required for sulfatase activity